MGLSGNGSEGLGGQAQGFEIQNQGVTRRAPGEGPKMDGGRSQSQEMDSYDQPQYEATELDEDAIENMKRSVHKMEFTRDRLRKSSEREKQEHPWMTGQQAKRVALDHEREKVHESPRMTEVFKAK